MPISWIAAAIAATAVLAVIVGLRAEVTRTREGKILAFVSLFLLPLAAMTVGFTQHMAGAQSTRFCTSCHVMEGFGKSLYIDDPSYIAARHFQNNRVPRDSACYTCHSDYTMFGPVRSKIRGLRHLWVQYLGTIPAPEKIKLYDPYKNANCLHCHLGARQFEEASAHKKTADLLARVKSGDLSCLSSGCHQFVHDVGSLKDQELWKEPK